VINLKLNNISFAYKSSIPENLVLDNISFETQGGTITSIIGTSGSGKTTLLKLIAGLLVPKFGEIYFGNELVTCPNHNRTIIFQDYNLYEWKTVAENIEFGLIAQKKSKKERKTICHDLLEMINLQPFANLYPDQLSGGMKQRVAIARALAVQPEYILMDEPFSALDVINRLSLQEQILSLQRRLSQTIIFVTHSIEDAIYLSDRILVLSQAPSKIILDIKLTRKNNYKDLHSDYYTEIHSQIINKLKEHFYEK
jgi:NitT/TauT family transport system ATP-binding protein